MPNGTGPQRRQRRRAELARLTSPSGTTPFLADAAVVTARILVLVLGGYIAFRAAQRLHLLVLPFAAALLLTALIHPVVAALRRRGLPSAAATALAGIALLGVLGAVLTWVVNRTSAQVPTLVAEFGNGLQQLPVRTETLKAWRTDLVAAVAQQQGNLTGRVISGVQVIAEFGTGLVLTVFLTFYFLYDGGRVWSWVVRLFPGRRRRAVHESGKEVWHRLSGWVRGTALVAVFHGVVVAIALWLLDVPLVASLAILVFIGSFIPIVGAFVFGGAAVLVAFATHGMTAALVLVGVLLVDNQIEAHILQPFLVGRYVDLHPVAVVAVITAGGVVAGIPGAILAVPLTAALNAITSQMRAERGRSQQRGHRHAPPVRALTRPAVHIRYPTMPHRQEVHSARRTPRARVSRWLRLRPDRRPSVRKEDRG